MKCKEFGGVTARGNPCQRAAGWGRDASTGPCKHHATAARKRPTGDGEVPDPPAGLSEQARATWRAVLAEWVLSAEELLTLQGALESWDSYQDARDIVREEGAVVATGSGGPKRNPAALIARDAFRDFRAAIRELGVSTNLEE